MIRVKGLENYFGGKGASGTYQTIINQLPPHHTYIEPFLGAGNIIRRKWPAPLLNWGMDINPSVIELWKASRLPDNYKISEGDAISLLQSLAEGRYTPPGKTLLYLDPPYPLNSRKSHRKVYPFELTEKQHEDMLRAITTMQNNGTDHTVTYDVAISTYYNDMYAEYLKNWRCIIYESTTRKGKATEYLYMNYPEPQELHDYRFLGSDYREREKIQNMVRRHVARLKRLPELQRNAIIEAIKRNF